MSNSMQDNLADRLVVPMPASSEETLTSRISARRRRDVMTGLPPASRAKDIRYHVYFIGQISRWAWRFYTHRLTTPGRWFFLVTFLSLVYGQSSLELQAYVACVYFLAVWTIAILCVFFVKPRVLLRAQLPDCLGAGETLPIEVEIKQMRRLTAPDLTILPHLLPPALDAVPEDGVRVPPLARGQTARARLGLRCNRRGVYKWQGFRVETDFPFGLLRAYRNIAQEHQVTVYPVFTRLSRLRLPTGRRHHPGGVALASELGESFEYAGNRDYREGDNIRDIDWRATARLDKLIVREYREEYFLRVAVVLDTHIPPDAGKEAEEDFERAVSLCAAVSDYMARSDYLVDIFAAGPNLYHLTAGRSLAYLDQILDILACVEENPEEPFMVLEPEILENLAQITTVICVFLDWNATRQAFVDRLQREGAGLKVFIARDSPCTLDPADTSLFDAPAVISRADFEKGIVEF